MKNFILALLVVLTLSNNTFANDINKKSEVDKTREIFYNELYICFQKFGKEIKPTTTAKSQELIKNNYALNRCYTKVAHKVIDKYYTKKNKEVKENLKNFLKSTYKVYGNIFYEHDYCIENNCGIMDQAIYTAGTSGFYRDMIENFIHISVIQGK